MLAPRQRRVLSPWLAGLLLLLPACRGDGRPTEPSAETEASAGPQGEVTPEPEPEPAGGDAAATAEAPAEGGSEGDDAGGSEANGGASGDAGASEGADAGGGEAVADAGATTSGGESPPAEKSGPAPLPSPIFGKGNPSCGRDPGVGQPIKSFSLPLTNGKTVTSQNLKGKVVLLNFWGTWCKPCLKELPEFDRLYRRYRKNGLVLLAIATDTETEGVINFAKDRKLAAKIATGGEELANSYKSPNFPFSFVVDENGIIQASYRGFKPECLGQLEQDIRGQLAAK
ncbi:MAG: redoxin domain-containing protein [Myxococcales bacterium]|nr:redoxin domain-containing protein [Myxococcales bacterium]